MLPAEVERRCRPETLLSRQPLEYLDGAGLQEALQRLERGEDPDKIEEEMGDVLESEEGALFGGATVGLRSLSRKLRPPNVDDELHEL